MLDTAGQGGCQGIDGARPRTCPLDKYPRKHIVHVVSVSSVRPHRILDDELRVMIGTLCRLALVGLCTPFLVFPFLNIFFIPIWLWALLSASRRIWLGMKDR